MIKLETLAKRLEDRLNENKFGVNFKIHSDAGTYKGVKDHRKITNGLLTEVSSSIVPLVNLIVGTQVGRLEITVALPYADRETEVIATHRAILDGLFQTATIELLEDESGDKYTVAAEYSLANTGTVQVQSAVGTFVTFVVNIKYGFIQNGLNSSKFSLTLDDTPIAFTDLRINRNTTVDSASFSNSPSSTKNAAITTSLNFNIELPATSDDNAANAAIWGYILGGAEKKHTLTLTKGNDTYTYSVIFGETNTSVEGVKNASLSLTLIESV